MESKKETQNGKITTSAIRTTKSDREKQMRQRQRERKNHQNKRGRRKKTSDRGIQSIGAMAFVLVCTAQIYMYSILFYGRYTHLHWGSYIEFLIRFSIEWHFINLFYLSSLFRLTSLSLSHSFFHFRF